MAAPGFNRSFSQAEPNGYQQHSMDKPQIYTVSARCIRLVTGPY
jgi:hypothetical protein